MSPYFISQNQAYFALSSQLPVPAVRASFFLPSIESSSGPKLCSSNHCSHLWTLLASTGLGPGYLPSISWPFCSGQAWVCSSLQCPVESSLHTWGMLKSWSLLLPVSRKVPALSLIHLLSRLRNANIPAMSSSLGTTPHHLPQQNVQTSSCPSFTEVRCKRRNEIQLHFSKINSTHYQ